MFLSDEFLLSGETARSLYHGVAQRAPIVDLHTHLSAADIAADRVYETLSEVWLDEDHYKWRAMRLAGVDEQLITGDADPWDRFRAWASTVPRLVRNPLYTWTHLELRRVFGIDLLLGPATAREIWEEAERQLPTWPTQRLLAHLGVRVLATTDDPTDSLAAHRALSVQSGESPTKVIPTFRPDAAHRLLGDPLGWNTWVDRLEATTGIAVDDLATLLGALHAAWERFSGIGGRASDHGLRCLPDRPRDPARADTVVRQARHGVAARRADQDLVLLEVVSSTGRAVFAEESVMQLHLGARRDVSPRVLEQVGLDAGADVIGDARQAPGLARFLADLEAGGALPRSVLFNVNPADNALFSSMASAFSRPGVASLVQWGSPWWFNDHEEGIRRQLDDLSQIGQLAGFVGMLSDSRSILSVTRHELFRRVLCDVIGRDVDDGRIAPDLDGLSRIVRDICTDNAVRYFGLPNSWIA
jgi:glucuronate isomerase